MNDLNTRCETVRVPFMAPELPADLVSRRAERDQLLSRLLTGPPRGEKRIAIVGSGGFGKTTLACEICHEDRVRTEFYGGILWATLGPTPDILGAIAKFYRALTGDRQTFIDVEEASQMLRSRIRNTGCLLVIDDVWDSAHLRPFLLNSLSLPILITTRNEDLARKFDPRSLHLESMTEEESIQLLMSGSPPLRDRQLIRRVVGRLGKCPLMLELGRANIQRRLSRSSKPKAAVEWLDKTLAMQGVAVLRVRDEDPRKRSFNDSIEISLSLLNSEDRRHYLELGILSHLIGVPISTVAALWSKNFDETDLLLLELSELSLLGYDIGLGRVTLHQVLRDYLTSHLTETDELVLKLHEYCLSQATKFLEHYSNAIQTRFAKFRDRFPPYTEVPS